MLGFKPIIKKQLTNGYFEIKPHSELEKYLNCFWISSELEAGKEDIIIPDLCCDIIMEVDLEGQIKSTSFCGVNNKFFIHQSKGDGVYLFGIRFYVWSVFLFSDMGLKGTLNQTLETQFFFKGFEDYIKMIFSKHKILTDIIQILNYYFLKRLERKPIDMALYPISDWIQKLQYDSHNPKIETILGREGKSLRQIQRLFKDYLGLTPKQVLDSIRFQKIMNHLVDDIFDDSALAYDYGFVDQSHFIKNFKSFSGSTPKEMRYYLKNR